MENVSCIPVCYLDTAYRGVIEAGGMFQLGSWSSSHANLPNSMRCFVWVSTDGEEEPDEPGNDIEDIIVQLVSLK